MKEPIKIDPDALYDDTTVGMTMRVGPQTLAKARRNGSLRFKRAGLRTLYFGRWLIDWLETPNTATDSESDAVQDLTSAACPPARR